MAKRTISLTGLCAAFAVSWVCFSAWALNSLGEGETQIYAENGVLETLQVAVLAAASASFLLALVRGSDHDSLILLFCALLCYSFIVRELDFEDFDLPGAIVALTSGAGRNIVLALAFGAVLAYGAKTNCRYYLRSALKFARTAPGLMLVAAGLLLYLGAFFESYDGVSHPVFYEEMLELTAYALILLSSLSLRLPDKTACQLQKSQ